MWGLMVAAHGFEPRTHRVWTDCSSQLSYAAMYGASDRDWTGDLILTKDTLCRLSYTSTMNVHFTVKLWLRGQDLNLRPSGYEPDELPTAPPRYKWWREKDSNLRSRRRQIYSLLPLAARGIPSINKMELAIGIEPTTCWLQVSCSTYWATPASLRQDVLYHLPH